MIQLTMLVLAALDLLAYDKTISKGRECTMYPYDSADDFYKWMSSLLSASDTTTRKAPQTGTEKNTDNKASNQTSSTSSSEKTEDSKKPLQRVDLKTFTRKENSANDPVNHPSHYTRGKIEVIDYIEDQGFTYNLGNAIKYISRAGYKDNAVEDLKKAMWYINREMERLQKG